MGKSKTHFAPPEFKLRLEVRLARLASRSPETSLPVAGLVAPFVEPLAPPWGCRMSPKKLAPTAEK